MRTRTCTLSISVAILAGLSAACSPQRGPVVAEPSASVAASALEDVAPSEGVATESMDDVAHSLAKLHYRMLREWFRRAELTGYTYAELVALEDKSEAAARYMQCHEWTRSPRGNVGRLELLSLCLREPAVDEYVLPESKVADKPSPSTVPE